MLAYDPEKLLDQYPTDPRDVDIDIAGFLYYCKYPLAVVRSLITEHKAIENELDFFESVLDAYWYYGTHYTVPFHENILCHLFLKQLVKFIRQAECDLLNILKSFEEFIMGLELGHSAIDNWIKVYEFEYQNKKIASVDFVFQIVQERVVTLITKKQDIISNETSYEELNISQKYVPEFLGECISLLLDTRFEKQSFRFWHTLYQRNQTDVVRHVLKVSQERKRDTYEVLSRVRSINQQRIAYNRHELLKSTNLFGLYYLILWAKFGSDNPEIRLKTNGNIALIGLDILSDISQKPQLLAKLDPLKIPTATPFFRSYLMDHYFSLMYFEFDKEQHPSEYQKLSDVLQTLATTDDLHLKYRVESMLVAYDCLKIKIENYKSLITEMMALPADYYWVNQLVQNIECRINDSRLFLRDLFQLSDVLRLFKIKLFRNQALRYLRDEVEKFSKDVETVDQIYAALQPELFTLLQFVSITEDAYWTYEAEILDLNELLIDYPLSSVQKHQILDKLQSTQSAMVAKDYYGIDKLSKLVRVWQENIVY